MAGLKKSEGRPFTWDDYQTWPDDERWEIIGGEPYAMTPAPTPRHQSIVVKLSAALLPIFEARGCRVYPSPLDVKLSHQDVVQPDIVIVCDRNQTKRTHIEGPPSVVIEVLSPSTALHDRGRKMELFARSKIGEVWIVTPFPSLIEIFELDGDSYRQFGVFGRDDTLKSPSCSEFGLALVDVFDFPLDPEEKIWLVKEERARYGPRPRS